MLKPALFKRVEIVDQASLFDYARALPKADSRTTWLFRGMASAFPLQTSLERILIDAEIDLGDAPQIERQLLKEFKRRAHFYLGALPSQGDVLGWLSITQHYGAPTRLLDWTYSFLVAAFLALRDAASNPPAKRRPTVVWALSREAYRLKTQAPAARAARRWPKPKERNAS
jgi:FRG domain